MMRYPQTDWPATELMYLELLKQYPEVSYLRYNLGTWAPELPTNGGKPSQGTKADKRLTRNKPTIPAKPATMPARKGK